MADEKKPKERKASGKTAPAEAAEPAATPPQTVSTKIPKLQKKDKARLPRRQKKAQQKATAS
jgi:hypothetical protein